MGEKGREGPIFKKKAQGPMFFLPNQPSLLHYLNGVAVFQHLPFLFRFQYPASSPSFQPFKALSYWTLPLRRLQLGGGSVSIIVLKRRDPENAEDRRALNSVRFSVPPTAGPLCTKEYY